MPQRVNLLIAAHSWDVELVRDGWPQFAKHLPLTPDFAPSGVQVDEYVWTPEASKLPAAARLRLRNALAPLIDENSIEETFPSTLLSW